METKPLKDRAFGLALAITGLVGLICSFVITVDKFKLLTDTGFVPSCSLNPIISCGSVMKSAQASVFGFPNSLMGLVGFGVVLAIGVAVLGRVKFPRWYVGGLLAGLTLAFGFVHWLISQSLYSIGALCPYCMVVWLATGFAFFYTLSYVLSGLKRAVPRPLAGFIDYLVRFPWFFAVLWYVVVIGLVLYRFWYYFGTLI